MNHRKLLALLAGTFLAESLAFRPAIAQVATVDSIRGKISGADKRGIEGVAVTVTSLDLTVTKQTTTNTAGIFQVQFPNGPGDYWIAVSAAGYSPRRFEVKRNVNDRVLNADEMLYTTAATQLMAPPSSASAIVAPAGPGHGITLDRPPERVAAQAAAIPRQLTDADFWKLINDISEPNGSYSANNFTSNEAGYEWPIPDFKARTAPGGVYLGVGPEQNFAYIVGLAPRLAIIFDIRRQNMILHLMCKALMEMSSDRADYIARLFSRRRPAGLDTTTSPEALFRAYVHAAPDSAYYRSNLAEIEERLIKKHGFPLGDSDVVSLEYVYRAFFTAGPTITWAYDPNRKAVAPPPAAPAETLDYITFQVATDSAGHQWAYLATEANYRWLRDFETRNLLVPVVGDFAGPKAIRAAGQYLVNHGATVTAFYLSNVEWYLFRQGDAWSQFYKNVSTLPIDSTSMFIRFFGNADCMRPPGSRAAQVNDAMRWGPNLTAPIRDQLAGLAAGAISTLCDILASSR